MQIATIDVKEEYKKRFPKGENEKFVDFIFDHKLFPQKIYFPAGASIREGYLSMLISKVGRIAALQKEGNFSLKKIIEYSFGSDVIIKNQDDILEEKGEIIISEYGTHSDAQVDKALSKLYPKEKVCCETFDAVAIKGKFYYILIQVGFLKSNSLEIEDTLPPLDTVILKEEKYVLYPIFEDIFNKILFKAQYFYLN